MYGDIGKDNVKVQKMLVFSCVLSYEKHSFLSIRMEKPNHVISMIFPAYILCFLTNIVFKVLSKDKSNPKKVQILCYNILQLHDPNSPSLIWG